MTDSKRLEELSQQYDKLLKDYSKLEQKCERESAKLNQAQELSKGLLNSRTWRLSLKIKSFAQKVPFSRKVFNFLKRVSATKELARQAALVKESGLFDEEFYKRSNPDIDFSKTSSIKHFLAHGAYEGRKPNKNFDPRIYLQLNEDVAVSNVNPLVHYIEKGKEENRPTLSNEAFEHNDGLLVVGECPLTIQVGELSAEEKLALPSVGSIAVHAHIFYVELLDELIEKISNIPYDFDAFVSTVSVKDQLRVEEEMKKAFPRSAVDVRVVVNRGRDIAPLCVEFAEDIKNYKYFCHIHSKRSLYSSTGNDWRTYLLQRILGSEKTVVDILSRLDQDQSLAIAFPEHHSSVRSFIFKNGWGADSEFAMARDLSIKLAIPEPDDKTLKTFPSGSFFWAKTAVYKDLFESGIRLEDFPPESGQQERTFAHVLERMFGYIPTSQGLKALVTKSHYEEQTEFDETALQSQKTKLIAYHLPQFYAFEENDRWWGKGFTEWTKVRAAKPLFPGHNQPRVPHNDIGYYNLTDLDALKKQADLAKAHGVYGFCFYHYWFTGKRIMEKPVDLLMKHPEVDINFCLCWANENWTRRWDGNDAATLIAQDYSAEDDIEFIKHLAYYMKDSRYIKTDGKPVIMVYRADLHPDTQATINRWRTWCRENGIGEIYLITTLVRGVVDPRPYGFDAGVERPFYNWEKEHITDLKMNYGAKADHQGVIYDHKETAQFYSSQSVSQNDFRTFRSLGIMWDPSPRHEDRSHMVHNTKPEVYQQWLTELIETTNKDIPEAERFVFLNAWNEWAEGTYLEPDTTMGYALLNATSQALLSKWSWRNIAEPVSEDQTKMVILEHGLGGGAQVYLERTLYTNKDSWQARVSKKGKFFNIKVFSQGEKLSETNLLKLDFFKFLKLLNYDELHVNNLASWKDPTEFVTELTNFLKTQSAKSTFYLHDYFAVCPTVNLLDNNDKYCGVPEEGACKKCFKVNENMPMLSRFGGIEQWRKSWGDLLPYFSEIKAFSESSKSILLKAYPGVDPSRVIVDGHDLSYLQYEPLRVDATKSLHICVVGGLNKAKGTTVLGDLAKHITKKHLKARMSHIGYSINTLPGSIEVLGSYDVDELPEMITQCGANVFLVPSIVPETFCYVVSELIALDVPLVCFDLGAQAERVAKYEKGLVLPQEFIDRPEEILRSIDSFFENSYKAIATT
ncbi:MAG: glycoside hydrolase family 99-like domain-containing protein [Lentisphaeraceae bacterium]|nr:glycoside hydrolase family 99-like domain-containing protein [Lentisphaeraceae bacterium]